MTVDINPGRLNLAISSSYPDGPLRTFGITDAFVAEGVDPALAEDLIGVVDTQVGMEDQALVEAAQVGLCNGIVDRGGRWPRVASSRWRSSDSSSSVASRFLLPAPREAAEQLVHSRGAWRAVPFVWQSGRIDLQASNPGVVRVEPAPDRGRFGTESSGSRRARTGSAARTSLRPMPRSSPRPSIRGSSAVATRSTGPGSGGAAVPVAVVDLPAVSLTVPSTRLTC